jgi:hypothetical protein
MDKSKGDTYSQSQRGNGSSEGGTRVEVTREQNDRGRRGATRKCTEDTRKESGGRAEMTVYVV